MKRHVLISCICVCLAALALAWGVSPQPSTQAKVATDTIALLLDTDIGTTAAQLKQGAKLAAREQKVDLLTAAPDGGNMTQGEWMLQLLDKNVKAVVLVPAQSADLTAAFKKAAEKKVPVICLGEGAVPDETVCVISGDERSAGALAAQALLDRIEKPGRVLVITGDAGDDAAARRLEGALEVLQSRENMVIWFQSPLPEKNAESVLSLTDAHPDANGILALTGESTELCAQAMARLDRDMCLVGMDCGQNRTTYLENRQVDAMVLGMPFAMGYLGVQFAVENHQGKEIPAVYYTESRVIDLDNMYLPENQKLAFPMLQ